MRYLIDSDWTIDWLKGQQSAVELLENLTGDDLAISLITFGEVYEGIYFGRDPERDEAVFQKFVDQITVLPLSRLIMLRFARIRGTLRRQGQIIGDPDILIAATALHHDRRLITRNMRHFQRIAEPKLY